MIFTASFNILQAFSIFYHTVTHYYNMPIFVLTLIYLNFFVTVTSALLISPLIFVAAFLLLLGFVWKLLLLYFCVIFVVIVVVAVASVTLHVITFINITFCFTILDVTVTFRIALAVQIGFTNAFMYWFLRSFSMINSLTFPFTFRWTFRVYVLLTQNYSVSK